VLAGAIPGVAHGPGATRAEARRSGFARARLARARAGAASRAGLLGRERRTPGARRRRLDLGEPEIRRAAMALPRGGGDTAIGPRQREVSLKRVFCHEQEAEGGGPPPRPRPGPGGGPPPPRPRGPPHPAAP